MIKVEEYNLTNSEIHKIQKAEKVALDSEKQIKKLDKKIRKAENKHRESINKTLTDIFAKYNRNGESIANIIALL